jgi:hypothetical protein
MTKSPLQIVVPIFVLSVPFCSLGAASAARWEDEIQSPIAMGTSAFVLLMSAENSGSSPIFGVALSVQVSTFHKVAGALSLAG